MVVAALFQLFRKDYILMGHLLFVRKLPADKLFAAKRNDRSLMCIWRAYKAYFKVRFLQAPKLLLFP